MASIAMRSVNVKSVLFASDFSPASESPLRHALAIARHYGAEFYLAHVASPHGYSIGCAGALRYAIEVAQSNSEQLNQQLLESGALAGLSHEFIVREGEVWEQLEQIIREKHADLVVVGTHARHAPGKSLLGSVAEQIFRHAECPVLTVPPGPDEDSPIEQQPALNTVLFPADFSEVSLQALPHAVSFANHFGAKLLLLHVLPAVPTPKDVRRYASEDVTQMREEAPSAILPRFEELITQQAALAAKPEFVVNFGTPAEEILHAARVHKADVIILGLPHTAPGNAVSYAPWATAYQVLCDAACPVLTIEN